MIGVDEVGRGCLAGPMLVVAARQVGELPAGLKDSKVLTKIQRENILDLLSMCCEFGEGWVSCGEIDRLGLTKATKLGVRRALKQINAAAGEEIIVDGNINYAPKKYKAKTLVKADSLIPIVSAASIHAKVARDSYMIKMANKYPGYGFEKHVGYGTKVHHSALADLGMIVNFHRQSFLPIKSLSL